MTTIFWILSMPPGAAWAAVASASGSMAEPASERLRRNFSLVMAGYLMAKGAWLEGRRADVERPSAGETLFPPSINFVTSGGLLLRPVRARHQSVAVRFDHEHALC